MSDSAFDLVCARYWLEPGRLEISAGKAPVNSRTVWTLPPSCSDALRNDDERCIVVILDPLSTQIIRGAYLGSSQDRPLCKYTRQTTSMNDLRTSTCPRDDERASRKQLLLEKDVRLIKPATSTLSATGNSNYLPVNLSKIGTL